MQNILIEAEWYRFLILFQPTAQNPLTAAGRRLRDTPAPRRSSTMPFDAAPAPWNHVPKKETPHDQ
ncbi:MAG: hypothetical protein KAY02_03075, partial [Acidovorax sp.]|nr:hypothetical protein [Acidovorax sp.]